MLEPGRHLAVMQKLARAAAFAAMLSLVPAAAHARFDTTVRLAPTQWSLGTAPRSALEVREQVMPAPPPATPTPFGDFAETRGDMAPGQSHADYLAWLARDPGHQAEVEAFRSHLASEGLENVVPI